MRKKRHFSRKRKAKRFQRVHKASPPGSSFQDDSLTFQILSLLYVTGHPVSSKQLIQELGLPSSARKPLYKLLQELAGKRILHQLEKDLYGPGSKHRLAEGVLDQNVKGFGFVTNLSSKFAGTAYSKDAFVSPSNMNNGRHGDTVLIRVYQVKKDGRPEAEVLSILRRGTSKIAGFAYFHSGKTIVYPEDTRYPFTIQILGRRHPDLREGDAVLVELDGQSDSFRQQTGTLLEILGDPDSVDVQMRFVIEKHGLPHIFDEETLNEAAAIPDAVTPGKGRLDLRDTQHITIDGETAKDFDDAICVQKTRKGFRLYVSIADVSHYVQPDSPIDREAYQRGTSIYFPGRVIPMLPEKLSNDLCSLVPHQDRYAFTAILDFNRSGQLLTKEFSKSIICSKQRFTYTTVSKIIEEKDPEVRRTHKPFLTPLKWAAELATVLMRNREERGSIGFTIPEPFMELDEQGKITAVRRSERNFAHKLIEEFMLAANEAVAELFTEHKLDGLYRIHERPTPEKIADFVEFSNSLGLELPQVRQDPDWFGQVLDLVKDTPKEYVVNNLLLRTMQQAKYDAQNVGHFGLAASDYTHFTSPIRRYPDLTVHRTLQAFLIRNAKIRTRKKQTISTKEMGPFLSTRERIAVTAEREMNDRLKIRFMHGKTGESFDAVISGVSGSVIFVELIDLFISGGISLTSLKDDHYIFDAKNHRLRGKHSGKTFQIGDLIRVILLDVDLRQNRIYFGPEKADNEAI